MTIQSELPNDIYKPSVSKPSLQQYDNYQIHDMYCIDIIYSSIPSLPTASVPPSVKQKAWLAVERVSPLGLISCDFGAIAETYK
jgi:hypothetical protein